MARGVNKVILVGRLGADPELSYLQTGTAKCTFRLATSEKYKDEEQTEWHRIVCWGKTAENCGQYLAKGSMVYLEGKLHTRSWDDQDGNKRYMTEVTAREVQFLDKAPSKGPVPAQGETSGAPQANTPGGGDRGSQGLYGAQAPPEDDIGF